MQWGVVDFAGGIVIHTSSGVASLILAICMIPILSYLILRLTYQQF